MATSMSKETRSEVAEVLRDIADEFASYKYGWTLETKHVEEILAKHAYLIENEKEIET